VYAVCLLLAAGRPEQTVLSAAVAHVLDHQEEDEPECIDPG
jgi:hypothetical protein